MSWSSWYLYLQGYLRVSIQGPGPEQFLNLAIRKGIRLWGVRRLGIGHLEAYVRRADYAALRPVARNSGCRVRIKARKGLPFLLRRVKRRWAFAAGAVVFVLLLYLMASFVWLVEVQAVAGELNPTTALRIKEVAAANGLQPGRFKAGLDLEQVRRQVDALPGIGWASVELQGTRALVTVLESAPRPPEGQVQAANIVAARDGIIEGILVLAGEAVVSEGETVRQGQVLISGLVQAPPTPGPPGTDLAGRPAAHYTRARGMVRARTWLVVEEQLKLAQTTTRRTGHSSTRVVLRLPRRQLVLFGPRVAPYPYFQEEQRIFRLPAWRNYAFPIELESTTYHELAITRRQLTTAEAKALLLEKAEGHLAQQLPGADLKTGQREVSFFTLGKDAGIGVRVVQEAVMDIGREQALVPPEKADRGGVF